MSGPHASDGPVVEFSNEEVPVELRNSSASSRYRGGAEPLGGAVVTKERREACRRLLLAHRVHSPRQPVDPSLVDDQAPQIGEPRDELLGLAARDGHLPQRATLGV